MQGIRTAGRKRVNKILLHVGILILACALIFVDQLTKRSFKDLYFSKGVTVVVDDFFRFTYTFNTGAAWSFLKGVSWAQTFFKVVTILSFVVFALLYFLSYKKNYKVLSFSLCLMVSGTVGNFIDRLLYGGVIDFISFQFGSYFFPIFNFADICLTFGVILMIAHFLFFDKEAVFKRKKEDEQASF